MGCGDGERARCYRKGWDVGTGRGRGAIGRVGMWGERCYRKGWDVGTGRGRGAIGRVGMWGRGEGEVL